MAFANINGFDLYYEIHGKGDPVILLHHGFGCTRIWEDIFPTLIENGYQTILYDRKGYGRSQREDDFIKNFYVSDEFRSGAADDLAALTQLLGLTSFHLIGQCEGGVVAVDYAAAHPGHERTQGQTPRTAVGTHGANRHDPEVRPCIKAHCHPARDSTIRATSTTTAVSVSSRTSRAGKVTGSSSRASRYCAT